MLKLVVPSMEYFPSHLQALRDGFFYGINRDAFSSDDLANVEADPEAYIIGLNTFIPGKSVGKDGQEYSKIPVERIWIVDDESKTFIGTLNFRPIITESWTRFGGHLGYGIVPALQGKGYGKQAFNLFLNDQKRITQIDRDHLILTTQSDNKPSRKIMEAHGARLVDKYDLPEAQRDVLIYHLPIQRMKHA